MSKNKNKKELEDIDYYNGEISVLNGEIAGLRADIITYNRKKSDAEVSKRTADAEFVVQRNKKTESLEIVRVQTERSVSYNLKI